MGSLADLPDALSDLLVVTDQARRWETEEALLRAVVENVPEIVSLVNLDGTFAYVNRTVPGLTREDVLGRQMIDFVPVEHRARLKALLDEVIATGERREYEILGTGPHGTTSQYLGRISPVRSGDTIVALIVVAGDVTERKRVEAQVRNYADVVEHVQFGLYIYRLESIDGKYTLRCVEANPASERQTGVPAREFIGRTIDEVFPGLRDTKLVEMAQRVARTGIAEETDDFWYGNDRLPYSAWAFAMFPLPNQCVGVTFQNITEKKQAEEQALRLRNELAHVARLSTMGEMASGMAHELNQPLTAIVAYADACQDLIESDKLAKPQLLEVLRSITAQAERAGKIIHRLRRLVKKSEPVRAPINVNDAVRDVAALLEPEARQAGVAVNLALDTEAPRAYADVVQIQQVLLNLVRNGIEAMAGGESSQRDLSVSTCCGPAGELRIAVCDRGPGISRETAERMFEPFFTTKPDGLGMGLPISRGIVEAHGGKLWATANAGTGLTIYCTLPAAEPGEAA